MAKCLQCDKEFYVKPSRVGRSKCCSWECRQAYRIRENAANRVQPSFVCEYCHGVFQTKPSQAIYRAVRFCSRDCSSRGQSGDKAPTWNGGLKTFECELCHTTFERKPSEREAAHTFCSTRCSSIWRKAHQKNKGTKIERLMKAALDAAGYSFEEQVPLLRTTIADFYSPTYQVAIFCDGDYWHNLPEHKERDPKQTATLEAAGITVLRFWEHEINDNIASCITRVSSAVTPLAALSPVPIEQ